MEENESIVGAREFLLEEYRRLADLHNDAKEVGETRLTFFVSVVGVVSSAIVLMMPKILPELQSWILGGVEVILISIGLATFRKMLQRRAATVVYRRRMSRIRAWFVKYYPLVVTGLPYEADQDLRMDWVGKKRLGSTAFAVAFINTAMIGLSVFGIGAMIFGTNPIIGIVVVSILSIVISWLAHIAWKTNWMKDAELRDKRAMEKLDQIISLSIDKHED